MKERRKKKKKLIALCCPHKRNQNGQAAAGDEAGRRRGTRNIISFTVVSLSLPVSSPISIYLPRTTCPYLPLLPVVSTAAVAIVVGTFQLGAVLAQLGKPECAHTVPLNRLLILLFLLLPTPPSSLCRCCHHHRHPLPIPGTVVVVGGAPAVCDEACSVNFPLYVLRGALLRFYL